MPMARTRSLQVIGPSLIRRVRIAVRMMEVSIGCGAVCSGILQGGWGTRQGAPQGSGGDGQDRPFAQEAVEAAPPGDAVGILLLTLLAYLIPVAGILPGAEGVAVHGVAAVEQDQQFGIVVVVHHQCPGAHGAAEHGVPQVEHLVGGEGGGDGGRHRVRCGLLWNSTGWVGHPSRCPVGISTPTRRGTHRSRCAHPAGARSLCGSRRGRSASLQTPGQCAKRWCRWRGGSNPTGCQRRWCQGRTR